MSFKSVSSTPATGKNSPAADDARITPKTAPMQDQPAVPANQA